jgi:hypothetical protein
MKKDISICSILTEQYPETSAYELCKFINSQFEKKVDCKTLKALFDYKEKLVERWKHLDGHITDQTVEKVIAFSRMWGQFMAAYNTYVAEQENKKERIKNIIEQL